MYGPVLVTLDPPAEPASGTVAARLQYDHPVLNTEVSTPHFRMPTYGGSRRHASRHFDPSLLAPLFILSFFRTWTLASMKEMTTIQGCRGIIRARRRMAWVGPPQRQIHVWFACRRGAHSG